MFPERPGGKEKKSYLKGVQLPVTSFKSSNDSSEGPGRTEGGGEKSQQRKKKSAKETRKKEEVCPWGCCQLVQLAMGRTPKTLDKERGEKKPKKKEEKQNGTKNLGQGALYGHHCRQRRRRRLSEPEKCMLTGDRSPEKKRGKRREGKVRETCSLKASLGSRSGALKIPARETEKRKLKEGPTVVGGLPCVPLGPEIISWSLLR